MWIAFKDFHGVVPRLKSRPKELPSGYARVCKNCKLENSDIVALGGTSYISTPTKAGIKKTIFKYKATDPDIWLHWTEDVDVVRSLVAGDQSGLFAFTGTDRPRISDSVLATSGGGTTFPTSSYKLGVPKPGTPSTPVVNGTAPTDEEILAGDAVLETVAYCYCLVASIAGVLQLGPLSDPTSSVDVSFGFDQTVTISGLDTSISSGYIPDVVKYLYRATTGTDTSNWQFVAEIPLATSSYTDSTLTADLAQDIATSEYYFEPPSDMINLSVMPNGILVGSSGNIICPSEPYLMHAFNPFNEQRVDYNIIAIGVFGQTAAILTDGQPYLYYGSTPSAMALEKLDSYHACISKRGLVDIGIGLLYPAPDGIARVGVGVAGLASADLFDKKTWNNDYYPSTISAYMVEGWYLGFYSGSIVAGFMFNPTTMEFVDLDIHATAGFNDLAADTLYLMVDGRLVQWDNDDINKLTLEYQTRPERVSYPCCMGFGQVIASDYPIDFWLYDGDDNLIRKMTIHDRDPFPIESGYLADAFSAKVSGKFNIQWIGLGETPDDLMEAYGSGEI